MRPTNMTIDTCEELDDAVEEYLEHRRFPNTLECFRSEIRHRKLLRCVFYSSVLTSLDFSGNAL